jgi:aminoglycoside phosphotransferase (APT) family kinase protein
VRRLVDTQFPAWAEFPLRAVTPGGTDNTLYRLGGELVVRLPRLPSAAGQAAKEHRWLPRLAPSLPLPVPSVVALGEPAAGYPWQWAVHPWLPGRAASGATLRTPHRAALTLAGFVTALHRIDAEGGPVPGEHNFHRGAALSTRDGETRRAIAVLGGRIDAAGATRAWEHALAAPRWRGRPTWIHGDLHGGNLLVHRGAVSAVIDFGGLAVGDPACDLMVAWTVLGARERNVFRDAVAVDDGSWIRGRGWALSMALVALPYYLDRDPAFAAEANRWLSEVLADGGP